MSISNNSSLPENQLLAALPAQEYQRLLPHLEFVPLLLEQVIYEAEETIKYVYFPHQALVSLVSTTEDGSTVEVGIVGNDGMVGLPVFLGGNTTSNRAFVQVAGAGMRMKASRLKTEFAQSRPLQTLLLLYTQALYTQISQGAACNRFHSVEERLARWLLLVQDRLHSDEFPLTQEFISQMLGTRRAGVTVAAGILSQAGIIRYRRGKITILDQKRLEGACCECYQLVKDECGRLFGTKHT